MHFTFFSDYNIGRKCLGFQQLGGPHKVSILILTWFILTKYFNQGLIRMLTQVVGAYIFSQSNLRFEFNWLLSMK